MGQLALALLCAGFADVTLAPGAQSQTVSGCSCINGGAGLMSITVDTPVLESQVVFTASPANVGPASGIVLAYTMSQQAGKLQIDIQSFRRDTGALVATSVSWKVEQLQRDR